MFFIWLSLLFSLIYSILVDPFISLNILLKILLIYVISGIYFFFNFSQFLGLMLFIIYMGAIAILYLFLLLTD